MRSLPSDWWRGWVREIEVLEESGQRTGSVRAVHWVPYPMGVAGHERFEKGVGEAEVVEGDKEHLEDVHDGWKRRKERVQEVDLGLHGFGTKWTLAHSSPFLYLWAQTGSGDEVGVGVGFLQVLDTLAPGLESPQGN